MKLLKLVKWTALGLIVLVTAVAGILAAFQQRIPASASAPGANSGIIDERYAVPATRIGEMLDAYRASLVSPSISVAVAVGGDLVWADARGYADIESRTPATTATVYAVGSVSKPLTAVLTAVLWEQGLLDIDADVRNYVADFPEQPHTLTLRQLLSHQAGIRHYGFRLSLPTFSESDLNHEFSSTMESLALFADDELLFEPDTGFNYSTFGYTLIAAAIEGAAAEAYAEALQKHVLDPLTMAATSIDRTSHIRGIRATDYVATFSKKAVLAAPPTNSSYKWAGGGLVSTPTDLAIFGSAMLDDRLLNEATRTAMFTPRSLPGGELNPQHYGLGWRIGGLLLTDEASGEERIVTLWNHGGTRAGSTAILLVVPDYEVVVAMATNTVGRGASGPLTSVAAKVARQFIRFEADGGRGSQD